MGRFKSPEEFKRTFDLLFETLSRDAAIGPALRATKTSQRFVFTDLKLVLNVKDSDARRFAKGDSLVWMWGDAKRTWEPVVTMEMTSELANRYFQGKENVPLALARGTIDLQSGDMAKVLDLLPIVAPFHKKWIATLKAEGLDQLVC